MPFVAPEAHLKPRTHKSSVGFAFVFAFFVFWEKYTNLQNRLTEYKYSWGLLRDQP